MNATNTLAENSISEFISSTNTSQNDCGYKGNASSIAISTPKQTYLPDEFIKFIIVVEDDNGCSLNSKVTVKAIRLNTNSNENSVYYKQTASIGGGFFTAFGVTFSELGLYNITGSVDTGENKTIESFSIIEIIPWYKQKFVPLLIIASVCFLAIVIISSIKTIRIRPVSETLRFLFISALVMSIVAVFLFINEEIGKYGPFGLVLMPGNASQWIINVGGVLYNNYEFGIKIPVYVFLFGIAGGYLRYLYKTSKMKLTSKPLEEEYLLNWNYIPGQDSVRMRDLLRDILDLQWITNQEFVKDNRSITITDGKHVVNIAINDTNTRAIVSIDNLITSYQFAASKRNEQLYIYPITSEKRGLFYRSLEDIALIFLSPLLAIAVWLLLIQGGVTDDTGTHMLAAVSFAVGLVTDDVIRALIGFVSSKLGNPDRKAPSDTKK